MKCWQDLIQQQRTLSYFKQLEQNVAQCRQAGVNVFPDEQDVFNAFELTPFAKVKVVILGQDPYHGLGQAHGLCFSVNKGVKLPPSLVNIYKELSDDIEGFVTPEHGNLSSWATQGVLLLNTVLTVEEGKAHSHAKLGWEQFTDSVLQSLNSVNEPIIFVFWGNHAIKKGKLIDQAKHIVLQGPHPSPLSAYRGFFGCGHFSMINTHLQQLGHQPINWQV
ncbi:uracil-DNA glycosylase [Shewanella maritima]|uniref:uracil-DNA glycosylase n=1 Tax=Shewanella maritima TaxID=2520507 RepID=UPI003735E7A3